MKITPEFKKRNYTVRFTLFQPEQYLEELNSLRNALPGKLKNHKVKILIESQLYGDGYIISLYVRLRETKNLSLAQHISEMGSFLEYVEGLISDKLTSEPELCDESYKSSKPYIRFTN